jgi:DNA-binding transcriptional regulator/RsmH inhibitor MraZ
VDQEVVLHCLPEGALGVYPSSTWLQMRQSDVQPARRAAHSVVFRRELRRFGALTQTQQISNQGRLTIPVHFRELVALQPGTDCMLIGTEIGLEIWNGDNWKTEFETLLEHERRKGLAEMEADLNELDEPEDA